MSMVLSQEVVTYFTIENEVDVVLAHKRAVQIGKLAGLSPATWTRFATAVSEITRNCVEYAQQGEVSFYFDQLNDQPYLFARIKDEGPGIADLELYLNHRGGNILKKGMGIANSKRLVDYFDIQTGMDGTGVILGKKLNQQPVSLTDNISSIQMSRSVGDSLSPYEELKKRNAQLQELTDDLKEKNLQIKLQLEENRRLSQMLETKNENLKQMAYLITHDLKNPLSTILLSCEMFGDEYEGDEGRSYLEMITRNANRMLEMMDSMQKNVEEEQGIVASGTSVKLKSLVKELKEQFSSNLKRVKGRLFVDYDIEEISYPHTYLYSILSNFLSNAIKYRSERPLVVRMAFKKVDDHIIMTFTDNGIGIDLDKHQNRLFKPFERLSGDGDGKGLGLSIVKHLISKNGGKIEVESNPGKGTCFICYLKEY